MTWASNSSNGGGAGTRAGVRDDDQVCPVKFPTQISQSNLSRSFRSPSQMAGVRDDGQILSLT